MACCERSASPSSKMFFKLPVTSTSFGPADELAPQLVNECNGLLDVASSHASNASVRNPFGAMIAAPGS